MEKFLNKKNLKVLSGVAAAAVFQAAVVPAGFLGVFKPKNSVFSVFGASLGSSGRVIMSGTQHVKQLPNWCWAASIQMMLRAYVFQKFALSEDNSYIHIDAHGINLASKCIEVVNDWYGADKSPDEFERLYSEKIAARTDGNGANSALNKEQAFLVYLSTDYLSQDNPFVAADAEAQIMVVNVVLQAAGLGDQFEFVKIKLPDKPSTIKIEGNKDKMVTTLDRGKITNEDIEAILVQALKANKMNNIEAMPVVTKSTGHFRVVSGIENGTKLHISDPWLNDRTTQDIGNYNDYEILFIAKKNTIGNINFDQDNNLRDVFLISDEKQNKVYVPVTEDNSVFSMNKGTEGRYVFSDSSLGDYAFDGGGEEVYWCAVPGVKLEDLRNDYSLKKVDDKLALSYVLLLGGKKITEGKALDKNSSVNLSTPEDLGYNIDTFIGWCASSAGDERIFNPGDEYIVDKNTRLYLIHGRKVTYHRNSNSADTSVYARYYEFDKVDELISSTNKNIKREGVTFAGWATDPEGKNMLPTEKMESGRIVQILPEGSDDVELYAIWSDTGSGGSPSGGSSSGGSSSGGSSSGGSSSGGSSSGGSSSGGSSSGGSSSGGSSSGGSSSGGSSSGGSSSGGSSSGGSSSGGSLSGGSSSGGSSSGGSSSGGSSSGGSSSGGSSSGGSSSGGSSSGGSSSGGSSSGDSSSGGSSSGGSSSGESSASQAKQDEPKALVKFTYTDTNQPISAEQAVEIAIKDKGISSLSSIPESNNGAIVFETGKTATDGKKEIQARWTMELDKVDKEFAKSYDEKAVLEAKTNRTPEEEARLKEANDKLAEFNFKLEVKIPEVEQSPDITIQSKNALKSAKAVFVDFLANGKFPGQMKVDLNLGKDKANQKFMVYFLLPAEGNRPRYTQLITKEVTVNSEGFVRFISDRGADYIFVPATPENLAKADEFAKMLENN